MTKLVWDTPGRRTLESGLDRGVLYLPDGSAVPWNGLTSVIEHFNQTTSPVYYDGMKIQDHVEFGDFSATMKAVTYPEEFVLVEGAVPLRRGVYAGDQPPLPFGLCYRTQIGDDLAGEDAAYKLHILFNITAIPSDKNYATVSDQPSLIEFEWTLSGVPEDIAGIRPTAHLTIDSRDLDPLLLVELEEKLYGGTTSEASLLPMPELVAYLRQWYRVKVVDNGDGTWTATWILPNIFHWLTPELDEWRLIGVNAVYIADDTYILSDSLDITDVPLIKITDFGDGTWAASTDQDGLINMVDDTTFEILNANFTYISPDSYVISDTEG